MQTHNANKQTKQSVTNPWFVTMIYFWESHSEKLANFKITEGMSEFHKNKVVALHFIEAFFKYKTFGDFR